MEFRTCDHLKEDGVYRRSPALKGRDYCYFHLKLRGRRLNMPRARALAADQPLDLPFPEDMHSVQVTLFEVVNALVNKRIDTKTAGIVLYAMQQASINLNNKHASQAICHAVEPDEPLLALEFRDFEEQYHLPKGIDLETNPEVALQESGALPETTAVETAPGVQNNNQKSERKRRKKHHRGERVPLPKPKELWEHVNPDAPFRAYASDGRELTRADAKRWQQRTYERMAAFVLHGDPEAPLAPDEIPSLAGRLTMLFHQQPIAAQYSARNYCILNILPGPSPFAPYVFNILGVRGEGEGRSAT